MVPGLAALESISCTVVWSNIFQVEKWTWKSLVGGGVKTSRKELPFLVIFSGLGLVLADSVVA